MKLVGITFPKPIYKSDGSGSLIEAGDTLGLRLYQSDPSATAGDVYQDVTVVSVADQGRQVHWDFLTTNVNPLDVAAVDVDHNPPACP